jgi:N-formylglutamate amidohydrolase
MGPVRDGGTVHDGASGLGEIIRADEVGLPDGAVLPWRLHAARTESPLVISIPHSGLAWPDELQPRPRVDFARNADYAVPSLYADAPLVGAVVLEARFSRLLVDLNRAGDDVSSMLVPDHPAPRPRRRPGVPAREGEVDDSDHHRPGRGVVWSAALGNVPLLPGPLKFAEFRDRIDRFHEPYHRALEVLLRRRVQRFGYAVLLDAHSMPCSVGADLVLGTLGGTSCGPAIERLALDALGALPTMPHLPHLRVRLNDPYHGGEVVRRCGRPELAWHALQLEVSRALYMDERTLTLYRAADAVSPRSSSDGRHEAPITDARTVPDAETSPLAGSVGATGDHTSPASACNGALHASAPAPPAASRVIRDFAELRRRVSCLIERLAWESEVACRSGTSTLHARVTDGDRAWRPSRDPRS